MEKIDINLQTKVAEMLNDYPQLEEVLFQLSPAFAKLKNPILRKTVARVATLKQVSEIAGLDPAKMISTLRKGANLDSPNLSYEETNITNSVQQPEWVSSKTVIEIFDVSPIINAGQSPMKQIIDKAQSLKGGQILKLLSPFVPTPIIELLQTKGYICWSRSENTPIETYITNKN